MRKFQLVYEMRCTKCNKKFVSKIPKLAPCPYCGKLNDNVTRFVEIYPTDIPGKFAYVDALTGKFLKPKTSRKETRS